MKKNQKRFCQWLEHAVEDLCARTSPPCFPVMPSQDPRPYVAVPQGCGQLESPEVLWHRLLEGTALTNILEAFRNRYEHGKHAVYRLLAGELHPERVRYFQKLARGRTWFTFAELVNVFGWHTVKTEQQPIVLLTQAALHRDGDTVSSAWWNANDRPHSFNAARSMATMRLAAVVWSAIVVGGLDSKQRTATVFNMRDCLRCLDTTEVV